jgi:hypothetical protein
MYDILFIDIAGSALTLNENLGGRRDKEALPSFD